MVKIGLEVEEIRLDVINLTTYIKETAWNQKQEIGLKQFLREDPVLYIGLKRLINHHVDLQNS